MNGSLKYVVLSQCSLYCRGFSLEMNKTTIFIKINSNRKYEFVVTNKLCVKCEYIT